MGTDIELGNDEIKGFAMGLLEMRGRLFIKRKYEPMLDADGNRIVDEHEMEQQMKKRCTDMVAKDHADLLTCLHRKSLECELK